MKKPDFTFTWPDIELDLSGIPDDFDITWPDPDDEHKRLMELLDRILADISWTWLDIQDFDCTG